MLGGWFAQDCTGVVHQNVNRREIGVYACSKMANCFTVRKIAAIPAKLPAEGSHFFLNRTADWLKRLADADDVGSCLGKRQGECLTNTSAAARDQRCLAIQPKQFENIH